MIGDHSLSDQAELKPIRVVEYVDQDNTRQQSRDFRGIDIAAIRHNVATEKRAPVFDDLIHFR
jgi:hypothetical protein